MAFSARAPALRIATRSSAPSHVEWAFALVLFLSGELIFAWPWLSGHLVIPYDAKAHFWPQLVFLSRSLHTGESPFWTPNVFAGHPQIADPQSLIFTPPFFLLAWFDANPTFREADALVFAMLALAGIATICFFRERDWHPAGALLAALSLTCGGSAAWRLQHVGEVLSLCWFVVTIHLASRAIRRGSLLWGAAAGLSFGLLIVGRDQVALLSAAVVLGHVVFHMYRYGLRRSMVPLIALAIVSASIAAIPIAFTWDFARESNRPHFDFGFVVQGSLRLSEFLTAVCADLFGTSSGAYWGSADPTTSNFLLARNMGDVYVGALPLMAIIAACIGWIVARRRRRPSAADGEIVFFALAAFCLFLYALGDGTPFFGLIYHLPGVSLFRRPADATFPFCALLSVLAGHALHASIARRGPDASTMRSLAWILALLLFLCFAIARDHLAQAQHALMISVGFLLLATFFLSRLRSLGRSGVSALLIATFAVTVPDLVVSNGANPSTGLPVSEFAPLAIGSDDQIVRAIKERLATSGLDRGRIEMVGLGDYWPNMGLVHDFDDDLGYNPVRLKIASDAMQANDQVAIAAQRKFGGLFSSYASPLANLLGLRLILSRTPLNEIDPSLRADAFGTPEKIGSVLFYDNPNAFPRVTFAHKSVASDFQAMLETGLWPDVDLHNTVLLDGVPPTDYGGTGTARLVAYHDDEVDVAATSSNGGYVVLNDAWQSWWTAEVDGIDIPILRANVMFRAVRVGPGRHVVRFSFHPFRGLTKDMFATIGLPPAWAERVLGRF